MTTEAAFSLIPNSLRKRRWPTWALGTYAAVVVASGICFVLLLIAAVAA